MNLSDTMYASYFYSFIISLITCLLCLLATFAALIKLRYYVLWWLLPLGLSNLAFTGVSFYQATLFASHERISLNGAHTMLALVISGKLFGLLGIISIFVHSLHKNNSPLIENINQK